MKNAIIELGTKSDQGIETTGLTFFRAIEYNGLRAELYLDLDLEINIVKFIGNGYSKTFEIQDPEKYFGN